MLCRFLGGVLGEHTGLPWPSGCAVVGLDSDPCFLSAPPRTQCSLNSRGVIWLFWCGAPLSGPWPHCLKLSLSSSPGQRGGTSLSVRSVAEKPHCGLWTLQAAVCPEPAAGCSPGLSPTPPPAPSAPGNWPAALGVKGHRRGRSQRGQKQGRGHTCCLRFCVRGHEAD